MSDYRLNVTLPEPLRDALEAHKKAVGSSYAATIRLALASYLLDAHKAGANKN